MLIELWRKVVATDYTGTCCAVCGNDFDRGSVFPVAFADGGYELGEMCPVCLDYLNRRKLDGEDPTAGPAPWANWPAREWPTLADLEEARRAHPEPMFSDQAELKSSAPRSGAEDEVLQSSMIWKMEPEILAEAGREGGGDV